MLLHSHKASLSSHSHQVRSSPAFNSLRANKTPFHSQTWASYDPSSSPEPQVSISRFLCQSSVGTARDSHLGYQSGFLARSTLLPPFVSFQPPPPSNQRPVQGSFITLVRLPCLLHLPPKLALMSTGPQNLPPTTTLLGPPTLVHALRVPCQSLLYQPPPNLFDFVGRFVPRRQLSICHRRPLKASAASKRQIRGLPPCHPPHSQSVRCPR